MEGIKASSGLGLACIWSAYKEGELAVRQLWDNLPAKTDAEETSIDSEWS